MNKHPLADCSNCPLQERPFVPSKGPTGAKYAVVGEAPGFMETLHGEPFVGPSGQLIKQVLSKAGIHEKDCFFTNAVLCRPDGNADPSQDAITACKPRLIAEVKGHERILLTGNIAARAVLGGTDGILKRRVGPAKPAPPSWGNGSHVVSTVHPAAVLRSADFFPHLVTDVAKLNAPAIEWREPKYVVADSERRALKFLGFLSQFRTLAVDIETAVEKDVAFEHPEDTDILCVGIAYDPQRIVVFTGDVCKRRAVRRGLGELLANSNLIAQNGKFDVPVLKVFDRRITLHADTMLSSYCLDERGGIHGLKVMAQEHLGAPRYDDEIKQYTSGGRSFGNIPPEILYRYNAYDCALTYQLYQLFDARLRDGSEVSVVSLSSLHDFLVRASNALMEVERHGVGVNEDYLTELDERFTAELATLEEALQDRIANPRSPLQVKAALATLGITTASTDVSHLQDILAGMESYGNHPQALAVRDFVQEILAYRKVQKLHGTYISGTRKRMVRGRVYPSYLLHGTTSGRLSCRNPNLQNIPRDDEIRRLFIPGDFNSLFLQADFKQGELRVVSLLAGEQYFLERFAAGRDPVGDVATELFGTARAKVMRTKTKNIIYGSLYGMVLGRGNQGQIYARQVLGMTNEQAYRYYNEFFNLVPNIANWQAKTRAATLRGEVLTTWTGRRRHFWLITDANKKDVLNECLAFVPQSSLSDVCLHGLCELVEEGFPVRITVHDSVVLECHTHRIKEIADGVTRILESAGRKFSTDIPFPVELKVGPSWGELADYSDRQQ